MPVLSTFLLFKQNIILMKYLLTGASLCMALLPSPLFAQGLQLTTDAEKSPALLLSKDTVDVPYETPFANVALQTNAGKFTLEAGKDATWVTPRAEANGNYTFFCTPHYDATQPRLAHFTLKSANGKISRPLVIRQLPNTSAASMADIMLPIASATAESEQPGEGIELSYDGDPSTIYHSSWGGCSLPQNLTYTLKEAAHIDYLVYTPRTGSPNGTFGEVEVFVATADKPNEWKSVAKADCEKKNSSSTILLGEKGIDQVKKVRIQVNTAGNDGSKNFVSCAEMAFYQYNASLTAGLSEYFADALCTSLKGISSEADLVKIGHPYLRQLAYNLLQGNYSTQFRVGEFSCYMNRGTLQQKLKTSAGYDPYENPTGIYFKKDDVIVVFAEGISADYPVNLCIKDFSNAKDIASSGQPESSYPLKNGANVIKAANRGNAYVLYYASQPEGAPKVKLHFALATEQGYFDAARHKNADWQKMLANGPGDNFDFITQRLHVVVPKANAKSVKLQDAEKLAIIYDSLIYREREIMGLPQMNKEPKNHQFARPVSGGMFADGTGAAAAFGSFNEWINPNNFGFWGMAHELGHVNQITPGFKWPGCGETTNNIYSAWVEHKLGATSAFGNGHHRLEDEQSGVNDYSWMRGGRFNAYLEEGVRKGVQWQLQDGPDYHGSAFNNVEVNDQDENGNNLGMITTKSRNFDHFVKVVPFWQLTLYTEECKASPTAFGRMIESYRSDFDAQKFNTSGKQQIEMMKRFCDASKINFLPFFEKAGLLKPVKAFIEDYSRGWLIITQPMIDELKAYVASKNYAEAPAALNYINAYNWRNFRDKVQLAEGTVGTGCTPEENRVCVDNTKWPGAVAYETYNAEGKPIRISMFGLGDAAMSSAKTHVLFPSSENASYIMAVGYDGKRVKCYQK